MAKSSAERQAAYRARKLADESAPCERLNMLIDLHAKRSLERLAACYGVTQKAMLEHVLAEAEKATIKEAMKTPHGPDDYYDRKLRLPFVTE